MNKNDFLISQLQGKVSEKDLKRIYGNVEKNDRFINYKKVKKALLGNVDYDDLNRPEKELYRVINGDEEKLEEKIDKIKNVIQGYEGIFMEDVDTRAMEPKDSFYINKQKVEDIIKKIEDNTKNYEEREELLKKLEEQVEIFKQKVVSIYKTEIDSLKKFYSLDIKSFVEQSLEKFNDIKHFSILLSILNERPAISDKAYFVIEKACGQNSEICSICSKLLQMINERSAVNEMFLPVDETYKVDKTYQNNLEPITEYPSDEDGENLTEQSLEDDEKSFFSEKETSCKTDVMKNISPIEAKKYEIDESDNEELEKTINLLENNGLSNFDYGRFLRNMEDFFEYKYSSNMNLEEEDSFAKVINNLRKKEEPVLDYIIQNNEQLFGKVLEIEKMIDTIKNSNVSYKEKQDLLNDLEKAVGAFKQQVEKAYKYEISYKKNCFDEGIKQKIKEDLRKCESIWDYRRILSNMEEGLYYNPEENKNDFIPIQDNFLANNLNDNNNIENFNNNDNNTSKGFDGFNNNTNNNNYELPDNNPFANNLNNNNNIDYINNNNNEFDGFNNNTNNNNYELPDNNPFANNLNNNNNIDYINNNNNEFDGFNNLYYNTNNNNYELPEDPLANNLNDNNNIENIDNNNNNKHPDPDQFQENHNNNIVANNVGNFKKSNNDIFDERYYKCRNDLHDYRYIKFNNYMDCLVDEIVENNYGLFSLFLKTLKISNEMNYSGKRSNFLLNKYEKAVNNFKQKVEEAYKKEIRDKAKDLEQTDKDSIEKELGNCKSIWDYRQSLNNVKKYIKELQRMIYLDNLYYNMNNNNHEPLPENPLTNNLNNNNNIENFNNNDNNKQQEFGDFNKYYNTNNNNHELPENPITNNLNNNNNIDYINNNNNGFGGFEDYYNNNIQQEPKVFMNDNEINTNNALTNNNNYMNNYNNNIEDFNDMNNNESNGIYTKKVVPYYNK